jgi:hypothetical protein
MEPYNYSVYKTSPIRRASEDHQALAVFYNVCCTNYEAIAEFAFGYALARTERDQAVIMLCDGSLMKVGVGSGSKS